MRKSIATVSLSGMLPEKLEAAAAARFDGVEIFENDLLQFPGTPGEVRRICADLGLRIDMFQPFRDFEGVAPTSCCATWTAPSASSTSWSSSAPS
jgi:4-hydroxyphenylpyruvate dioxygenase